MRTDLLGLPLEEVLERLHAEGREPAVEKTRAPRRRADEPERAGIEKVIYVSDDGTRVVSGLFPFPDSAKTR